MMAARSLIALYREQNADMLHRRDRGKLVNMARTQDPKVPCGAVKASAASLILRFLDSLIFLFSASRIL